VTFFSEHVMFSEEWGSALQRRVEEHMEAMAEYAEGDYDPEDDLDADAPETVTDYPYCGCSDCYYRELIALVVQETLVAAREGVVELIPPDAPRGPLSIPR
jgi:hypothetical protein